MAIERTVNGVVDFLISSVERIEERDDIDIEKKAKIELAFLRECRGFVAADLQYKNLLIKAPDVAKNRAIVLPLGTPKLASIDPTTDAEPKDEAAQKSLAG